MNYALYKDNYEYILITESDEVYSFDDYENITKLDGKLNMNVEYHHLGKKVKISDIKSKIVQEYVINLINTK